LVVFGGMMAAILVPNFLESLQRAKQQRTMADLRSVGVGIEIYRTENGGAPAIESYGELEALLTPEPLAGVSATDGWDQPLRYECVVPGGPTGCTSYRLGSPGLDGEFDEPSLADYEAGTFHPTEYDADIVYGDGVFVRYPERP
jgi:general secretion pathway protein G